MVSTIFGLGLNQQIPIPVAGAPDVIVLPDSQFIPAPGQTTFSSGGFSSNAPFFATMATPAAAPIDIALPLSQSLDVAGAFQPTLAPARLTLSAAPAAQGPAVQKAAAGTAFIGPPAVDRHEQRDPFLDFLQALSGSLGIFQGLLGGPVAPRLGAVSVRSKKRRKRRYR